MRTGCRILAALLGTVAVTAPVAAQTAGRLVDGIGVSERDDHVDLNLQFSCTLLYRGATGSAPTDLIRVRLVPGTDCGDTSGALASAALLPDAGRYLKSLDWDQLAGRELSLTLQLAGKQNYVLIPTSDNRGLRLRLLLPKGAATVQAEDLEPSVANFAVNLEAALTPYDDAAIAAARESLGGVPVYVSTYELPSDTGNQTWYRLRAGPFTLRSDAENLLRAARADFPGAWLAIGDESALDNGDAVDHEQHIAPTLPGKAATLTTEESADLLQQARRNLARKQYDTAIQQLTRLLEQPEFPARAEAQEMMGLARERNRQLAHAKAEYEEYLRRYPDGAAVKRVRDRLRALALATRAPGVSASAFGPAQETWQVYGGVAQHYRRDTSKLKSPSVTTDVVSQNAVLTDFDTVVRRRGDTLDFTSRASANYIRDLLPDGPGNRLRVSSLFAELADRDRDWSARLGRQTQNTGGLFGTFDGVSGGWQYRPQVRFKAAVGYPVELASDAPDTGRRFMAVATDFGPFGKGWESSVYAITQQYAGRTDRQVLGSELKYFHPDRTLVALADYDVHFGTLNNAYLLGSVTLPARWTVSLNLDRRRSPLLSLRNALIGQSVPFDALTGLYTSAELERLALDRSAISSLYDIVVSRPFGERWQWSLDYSMFSIGSTPESGGVEATPASGTERAVTLQGMAFALFGGGDLSTLALRHQSGASQDVESIGVTTRVPVWGAWRLGPSLRVDRLTQHTDASNQWLYVPALRLDLQRTRYMLDVEMGAEMGKRDLGSISQRSTRLYFSLGYRMNF